MGYDELRKQMKKERGGLIGKRLKWDTSVYLIIVPSAVIASLALVLLVRSLVVEMAQSPPKQADEKQDETIVAESREEARLAEEARQERERLEQEHVERLRSRAHDVRNVCWGDSQQTVKEAEVIPLKDDFPALQRHSLSGTAELVGCEASLSYIFYEDKLIAVSYWIHECENPFKLDARLVEALEEKYGMGRTETAGIRVIGKDAIKRLGLSDSLSSPFHPINEIDMNAAYRKTMWDLPRQTIELSANSYNGSRHLSLTYEAKSAEIRAYKEQEEQERKESLKKGREELKKSL